MIRLIYSSIATHRLSTRELFDLLDDSRSFNKRHGLTGLLVYAQGRFLQVLEGPEETVNSLYEKIVCDTRHEHCVLVLKEAIEERLFDSWAMAFKKLTGMDMNFYPGFSDFLFDDSQSSEKFNTGHDVIQLLQQFKQDNQLQFPH